MPVWALYELVEVHAQCIVHVFFMRLNLSCDYMCNVTYHVTQCIWRSYTHGGIMKEKGGNIMKRKLTSRKLWVSVANYV